MIDVEEKKAKIIEVIKVRGPSLPIHVSKEIELSSLFTSAIMSEMTSNKMLKTSNLKVGGSPLYLVNGQESLLENFSNYLGMKEKEVFLFLKERGVVQDEKLEPAYRVAIRSVKDFAIPLKVNVGNEEKIFWRYLTLPNEQAIKKIRELTKSKTKETEKKEERKVSDEEKKIEVKKKETKPEEGRMEEKISEKITSNFHQDVNDYISKSDIEIIREIDVKKKDAIRIASINSSIGKIQVLLIAKDKKTITENDLNLALGKGQEMRLPVLLISSGKLNKKAVAQIETFKSYLIFKQLEQGKWEE